MTISALLLEPTFTGWQLVLCILFAGAYSGGVWHVRGKRAGLELCSPVATPQPGTYDTASHVELVEATVSSIKDPNAPPDARVKGFVYTATLRCKDCGLQWVLRTESTAVPSEGCRSCLHATKLVS